MLDHPAVTAVQVVIHPDDAELYASATAGLDLPPPVAGGATRQESVRKGLEAVDADLVLIHDAARPLVGRAVIDRVLGALASDPGAIPALPVVDSLRRGGSHVEGEVERDRLWQVQTPQGFRLDAIRQAHRVAAVDATDDAAVLRAAGGRVAIVEGDEGNFKLTTENDFVRAEMLLRSTMISRTGTGFDVHRFGPGDHVWLCGVRVPHPQGLVGHSDADVGLHALTDAILGAIGAGDIGQHFPPSEERWAGASSDRFLAHAASLVDARRGCIDHVDVTIIAERPKVGPVRDTMRRRIGEILGLSVDAVSVKATTTEGLGFTGRAEGIAAQAAATVRLPLAENDR
jgi:2-C-methyl-D-erythritol 4-phosphate cytidylyltransferase/2-C-methyl-D-erythritol 2,4-cyclodiphosphate synthase